MGALAKRSAVELAAEAAGAVLDGTEVEAIDQVIVGQVLTAGTGWCAGQQLVVKLGLPLATPGYGVNMACASGLLSVALAAQTIRSGEADVILCGGTESMSNAPYLLDRAGGKLGDRTLADAILRDALVDTFHLEHMGVTAERLAEQFSLSRQSQDAYAVQSQQRAGAAHEAGLFADELVAVDDLDRDEHARPGTTPEQLASLRPAFARDGTVTAGNASGINDGAAMLLVCDEATADREGWCKLARIVASASAKRHPPKDDTVHF